MAPSIEQKIDDYDLVRFEDSNEVVAIRTPEWADRVASSVVEDAEVRTGNHDGGDDSDRDPERPRPDRPDSRRGRSDLAETIVEKIDSSG